MPVVGPRFGHTRLQRPQAVFARVPVLVPVSVNLASDLERRSYRSTARAPHPHLFNFLGPTPPTQQQQTVSVTTASGILTNQRRATQRRTTLSRLAPPTVVLPQPTQQQQTIQIVTQAVQPRRNTEQRRFPLQGWEGWLAQAEPATPTLDNFNRPDASPAGEPWVAYATETGLQIVSNTIKPVILGDAACWDVAAFPADVTVKATLVSNGSGFAGIMARCSGPKSSLNGYVAAASGNGFNGLRISRFVNAAETLLVQTNYSAVNTDVLTLRCVGTTITATVYDVNGNVKVTLSTTDSTFQNGGYVGIRFSATGDGFDNFGASAYTGLTNPALTQRLLGPRPPAVVFTGPTPLAVTTLTVKCLPQAVIRRQQAQQRASKSRLFPVPAFTQPTLPRGPSVSTTRTRPRRRLVFLGAPTVVAAPAPPTQQQQTITVALTRQSRRRGVAVLFPQPPAASTFVASPIQTNLVDNREHGLGRHHFPSSFLYAPSVLAVFPGPRVILARTRPRDTSVKLFPPTVVGAAASLYFGPQVTLAGRTRREQPRRFPLQGWTDVPVLYGGVPSGPILDNFNRANESPLSNGGQWQSPADSGSTQQMNLVSNAAVGSISTSSSAAWKAPQGADMQASVTVLALAGAGNDIGVALRAQLLNTAGTIYYEARYLQGTGWQVFRINGGVTTQVGSTILGNNIVVGDKIAGTISGSTIQVWRFDSTNSVWILIGTFTDGVITGVGSVGIRVRGTSAIVDDFTGGPFVAQQLVSVLRQPFLGPRPPMLLLPLPTATTDVVANLTQALVRREVRPRRTIYTLSPPTVTQTFAGPAVTAAKIRPRRTSHVLTPPTVVRIPSVEQLEQTIRVSLVRTRPRGTRSLLTPPVVLQTFAGPRVALVRTRPRPTRTLLIPPAAVGVFGQIYYAFPPRLARTRPRGTRSFLTPPTALQTFQAARTPFVRTRPRPTTRLLAPPPTLEPESVQIAERQIRVALVRTRPRHTVGTRLALPTALQVFTGPTVAVTKTRPRATRRFLTPPTVLQTFAGPTVKLVQTRPRHPISRLQAPTAVIPAGQVYYGPFVKTAKTRPRKTISALSPPTTLQVFRGPVETEVAVRIPVEDRRRGTHSRLSPPTVIDTVLVRYERVALVRTKPRPTTRFIGEPTVLQTFAGPVVKVVQTRPRPTTAFLLPPTVIRVPSVEQLEQTIRVSLVRVRPRPTTKTFIRPVTYPATSRITVALVSTRPRRTHSILSTPTVLQTFAAAKAQLVRPRARPTAKKLGLPTVVRVPSVEQREQTIAVRLVRTRPRSTARFIVPPLVKTFPPVVTVLTVALAGRTRADAVRRNPHPRYAGPVVIAPLPTLRQQTIQVALTRTEPRHVLSALRIATVAQTASPVESTIRTHLSRIRPRSVSAAVASPVLILGSPSQLAQTVQTTLTHTRPRPTFRRVSPPTVVRIPSVDQRLRTITTALVRTRPRPTTKFVAEPTVLRVFAGPSVALTHTRPRHTVIRLAPPTAITKPTFTGPTVVVTRTRPRSTAAAIFPPTVLNVFSGPQTHLIRTRPRPTIKALRPPTIVRVPSVEQRLRTIAAALVRTRPRPTTHRLFPIPPPRPVVTEILTQLVRARPQPTVAILLPIPPRPPERVVESVIRTTLAQPLDLRRVRSKLEAPTVVNPLPTPDETTIRVVLAVLKRIDRIRRRPHYALFPPAVVPPSAPGFVSLTDVPASAAELGDVGGDAAEVSSSFGDIAELGNTADDASSIEAVGDSRAEVTDQHGGTPL